VTVVTVVLAELGNIPAAVVAVPAAAVAATKRCRLLLRGLLQWGLLGVAIGILVSAKCRLQLYHPRHDPFHPSPNRPIVRTSRFGTLRPPSYLRLLDRTGRIRQEVAVVVVLCRKRALRQPWHRRPLVPMTTMTPFVTDRHHH
jgi:hypothetical protein